MPKNNSLWAVIEELRAEIEQVESYYKNALDKAELSIQEVEVRNAKQRQIIEDQKSFMSDFTEGRRQHEREQEIE
jgi:endonuclease III|tara:strand:+ start:971 stop:1195 length:225 start_codon:yes stop_codon:yes gene_type:complete